MKKQIIGIVLVLSLFLVPVVGHAQTVDLQTQFRNTLLQLIQLLFKQVAELQAQIQAQQQIGGGIAPLDNGGASSSTPGIVQVPTSTPQNTTSSQLFQNLNDLGNQIQQNQTFIPPSTAISYPWWTVESDFTLESNLTQNPITYSASDICSGIGSISKPSKQYTDCMKDPVKGHLTTLLGAEIGPCLQFQLVDKVLSQIQSVTISPYRFANNYNSHVAVGKNGPTRLRITATPSFTSLITENIAPNGIVGDTTSCLLSPKNTQYDSQLN